MRHLISGENSLSKATLSVAKRGFTYKKIFTKLKKMEVSHA